MDEEDDQITPSIGLPGSSIDILPSPIPIFHEPEAGLIEKNFLVVLAGALNREDFLPHGSGKVDKSELLLMKEVILPAFVNDSYKVVLGRSHIGYDSIDLPQDQ